MAEETQYSILLAEVIFSTPSGEEVVIDVRSSVLELQLFENLHLPYIDARIVIVDDFGLRSSFYTQGSEKFRLRIGKSQEGASPIVDKEFYFSKIVDTRKMNDRADLLSIDLVEPHVYINSIKQISRSYSSGLDDMIINIFERDLGKTVVKDLYQGVVQGPRKVIIPYLSPIEAVHWLKDRASTDMGCPIYVTGDLYSQNLVMTDLEKLTINQEPINLENPYRYVSSMSASSLDDQKLRPFYEIQSVQPLKEDNLLSLYEQGAIGSEYENLDAGTGLTTSNHISIRDILREMYAKGIIDPSVGQSFFDPSLEIDGKLSDEYNSVFINQVTSSKTYYQYSGYHDETILLDGNRDIIESRLKIKGKVIRQFLKKNTLDIAMNGISFFTGKITPGRKLRLLFLNSDVTKDKNDLYDQIDPKKSGDYLLLAVRHRLSTDLHNVSLRVLKLSDLPSDFSL